MKPSAWAFVLIREMRAQLGRVLLMLVCTALTCAICGLALHALGYLHFEVRPYLLQIFPEQRLVARPANVDIAIFKLETAQITEEKIAQVRAIDGVEAVYPQAALAVPAMADVSIRRLDVGFETDVVILGVPQELIAGDLPEGMDFSWQRESERPVPVALSAYFFDMYNMGLAESGNLPKLSRGAIIGREFTLSLGESTIAMTDDVTPRDERAILVGLVTNPDVMGLVVPLETVLQWNREFRPDAPTKYTMLHIDLHSAADEELVRRELARLGLDAESPAADFQGLRQAVTALESFLLIATIVILALAAVGIISTVSMAARERRAAWALHRATGMTPLQLLSLVKMEAILIALIAGGIAWASNHLILRIIRIGAGENIQNLTFLPGDPLAFKAFATAGIFVLAGALVIIPAGIYAFRAGRIEPARMLQEKNI